MDQKTPFYSFHKSNEAKLVSFAGYHMPIQYKNGVNFEHNHVRNQVGVFDVSHMGQIIISGNYANQFIQKITCNNVDKLFPGKVQYSCMLNAKGGIIDDLLIYCLSYQSYMLVVNAANHKKDLKWILDHNEYNCEVFDNTKSHGLLAIQGPLSNDYLQSFTDISLNKIPYYSFEIGKIADCENVIISNTGYTGATGFELYVHRNDAAKIWKKLFSTNYNVEPIGLAARDTLRLEMGYCLYGNDIDEDTSPIEAGLGWITKFSKNFINSKNLKRQKLVGTKKKLVGIELLERGIPRKGYEIVNDKNVVIGNITSGTMSPSLSKGIGMGYIDSDKSMINSKVGIKIRNKVIAAKIVKTPFVII